MRLKGLITTDDPWTWGMRIRVVLTPQRSDPCTGVEIQIPTPSGSSPCAVSILGHRRRRWPRIETALGQRMKGVLHRGSGSQCVIHRIPFFCDISQLANLRSVGFTTSCSLLWDCVGINGLSKPNHSQFWSQSHLVLWSAARFNLYYSRNITFTLGYFSKCYIHRLTFARISHPRNSKNKLNI